jgi:hypothetical protein
MEKIFQIQTRRTNTNQIQEGDLLLINPPSEPALGFTPEDVANKATNLTSPDNTKYPTTQAVVDGLALKQNLPAVQSSSITAVLDEVYNNVGNNIYTDPTGAEGKFYTVNVLSGVATIGGVGYTEGSIVRRIFEGGVWKSKEYKDVSKVLNPCEQFFDVKTNGIFGSHTGTTAETVLDSIDIPGGYYTLGDYINFLWTLEKIGTNGNATIRARVGTTGTTADELLATGATLAATTTMQNTERKMIQCVGGGLRGFRANVSIGSDIGGVSGTQATVSLDYTAAWKLTFTIQLVNSSDEVQLTGYRISKIKHTN